MTTLYPLTLANALTNLRIDVSDPDAARWSDAQLTRAIDRSRERLSEVFPLITTTQSPTTAGVGDYPLPSGAWWVDSLEWPLGRWPRRYVHFTQLRDTAGNDIVRLTLPPYCLPDGSDMLLAIAGVHTLDDTGTTIPERFWDCLLLGGQAFAYDLYLTNVLDNFVFADGMLRDKVDDTASMEAWQAQASSTLAKLTTRLDQIRAEFNAHQASTVQWGEISRRWDRI
jgi:hypothetical protein